MRLLLLSLFLSGNLLFADSFSPPSVHAFGSTNRSFVFVVTPAGFQDPKYPHPDTDPAIQKFLAKNKICVGTLLQYAEEADIYFARWIRPLVNSISPVSALVSDDGAYVVTCGDLYGSTETSIAIAIYNSDGFLIKSFTPKDLLGDRNLDDIPQTSCSILWGKMNRIDSKEKRLVLDMWDSGDPFSKDCKYRLLKIDLKDGSIVRTKEKMP